MALLTYQDQVSFAKHHIKTGALTHGGSTWQHGRAWGRIWSGIVAGYLIVFETIGDGPYMRPGSFRVHFVGAKSHP